VEEAMNENTLTNRTSTEVEKTREQSARRVSPPVDIFENADGFLILADLPGVDPSGLTVEYNPPELHVAGHLDVKAGGPAVVYERRFDLGSGVDTGSISAELRNGVLRIEMKKSAALRPRRIQVQAS
jgi:HSP20 family molecular chaperone IbpA